MTNLKQTLTEREMEVLVAMHANAEAVAGGDFGIVEELSIEGMSRKRLGGYLSILGQKNMITVYPTERVNGTDKVTQFIIEAAGRELIEAAKADEAGAEPAGMDDGTQTAEPVHNAAFAPSLPQSDLERAREIKVAEYRHAISRATQQINDTLAKLADRGVVSTHDGFNLGATASDLQALAAQIELLDQCIRSAK